MWLFLPETTSPCWQLHCHHCNSLSLSSLFLSHSHTHKLTSNHILDISHSRITKVFLFLFPFFLIWFSRICSVSGNFKLEKFKISVSVRIQFLKFNSVICIISIFLCEYVFRYLVIHPIILLRRKIQGETFLARKSHQMLPAKAIQLPALLLIRYPFRHSFSVY